MEDDQGRPQEQKGEAGGMQPQACDHEGTADDTPHNGVVHAFLCCHTGKKIFPAEDISNDTGCERVEFTIRWLDSRERFRPLPNKIFPSSTIHTTHPQRDKDMSSTPYTCDPTVNFVDRVRYEQIDYIKDAPQHEAIRHCEKLAEGRDFFVQQHRNGHTICGFFKVPLSDSNRQVTHGHTYGAVCRR